MDYEDLYALLQAEPSKIGQFVLLYRWVEEQVWILENELAEQSATIRDIAGLTSTEHVHPDSYSPVEVLATLRNLDALLFHDKHALAETRYRDRDGLEWRVGAARPSILSTDYLLTPEKQGHSVRRYARFCRPLPVGEVQGFTLEPVAMPNDVSGWLALDIEDRSLSVVLWRFRHRITSLTDHSNGLVSVSSADSAEQGRVDAEVEEAVEFAASGRHSILVLPELSIPKENVASLCQALNKTSSAHPRLVVVGCYHEPDDSGAYRNVARVFDFDGNEIAQQSKLSRFGIPATDAAGPMEEWIVTGSTLTVLESEATNLAFPICLDLFQARTSQILQSSNADMFLAPSMSDKTGPHAQSAADLARSTGSATFVANRGITSASPPGGGHVWAITGHAGVQASRRVVVEPFGYDAPFNQIQESMPGVDNNVDDA